MNKVHIILASIAMTLVFPAALAEESGAKGDLMMPWIDPGDPYVIRLNRDDPTVDKWNERNQRTDANRKPGPIDLNRYERGYAFVGFPTFLHMPVATRPEDLKAGDIDVAIVGSTTDMNGVLGTSWAANVLRGGLYTSAYQYQAKGDGKQTRETNKIPLDQYLRSSLHELNIVDYGNMQRHQMSGEKTAEEMRRVLGEIYEGDAMPMVVGGSHDNMYGLFMAVADKYGKGNFTVLHFDSHIDAVPFGYGYYVHNANGLYMGVNMGLFEGSDVVQVGMTSTTTDNDTFEWSRKVGFRYHYQAEIERDGWKKVMERVLEDVKDAENLVITLDIDIMDQKDVPGTGGREPDGPSAAEMMHLMRALAIQNNVVAVEISEYNPLLDTHNLATATVVRNLMKHYLFGLAARKRGITDPFHYHPHMVDDGR